MRKVNDFNSFFNLATLLGCYFKLLFTFSLHLQKVTFKVYYNHFLYHSRNWYNVLDYRFRVSRPEIFFQIQDQLQIFVTSEVLNLLIPWLNLTFLKDNLNCQLTSLHINKTIKPWLSNMPAYLYILSLAMLGNPSSLQRFV